MRQRKSDDNSSQNLGDSSKTGNTWQHWQKQARLWQTLYEIANDQNRILLAQDERRLERIKQDQECKLAIQTLISKGAIENFQFPTHLVATWENVDILN